MMAGWAEVLIAILLAFFFVFLGSRVQKGSKLVYPADPVTIVLVFIVAFDLIFYFLDMVAEVPHVPMQPYAFHLPILVGYLLGYWLNGLQKTKQLIWTDENGNDRSEFYVFYENNRGKLCIADQSNKQMLKRIIWGIHHEVHIPGGLTFYQRETKKSLKLPWWPSFRYEEIEILDIRPMPTKNIKKGRKTFIQYHTRIILADKYHVRPSQFRKEMALLKDANITITYLSAEINDLKNQMETRVYERVSLMISEFRKYRPLEFYWQEKERKKLEEEVARNALEAELEKE